MRLAKAVLLVLVLAVAPAFAALKFPELSGRVVDDAHILSPQAVQGLTEELASYERTTTNQLVVVTVRSLQGVPVEQYGYQLGRAWGIGQKGKNNGIILLVAPKEHKVRIEVGYGLEGELTDAVTSTIIQSIILPDFRTGNIEKGIIDGAHAVMGGKQSIATNARANPDQGGFPSMFLVFIVLLVIFRLSPLSALFLASSFNSRGYGGDGFSSGGFSGGGGSFGGGGASGGW